MWMLSLEPKFSEQWFLIIFGVLKSYYLFAFYDHRQLPPRGIFLNGREIILFSSICSYFTLPKSHPRSFHGYHWSRSQQPLLLISFVCFLWCIINNSLATVKGVNEGEKAWWEPFLQKLFRVHIWFLVYTYVHVGAHVGAWGWRACTCMHIPVKTGRQPPTSS